MPPPKIILHIDDDEDDLFLLSHALASIDHNVILHPARNGEKAMEFLRQARLFGDMPGLIILDINMPVMNGMETYREIKKDAVLAAIPLVVFSTTLTDKDKDHWEEENIIAFTKPVQFKDFVDCATKMVTLYKPFINNKSY